MIALGNDGIRKIWHDAKLRGRGYSRAGEILKYARESIGILAEMGDISRFDDVKEIQKLSGLGLIACSSGKHKGTSCLLHDEKREST